MKTIKNDFALQLCTGQDNLRPILHKPVKIKDYIYATNSYSAIKIKEDFVCKKYEENVKFPNIEKIFNECEIISETIISFDNLLKKFIEIDINYEYDEIQCDECNGDGEYICSCCGSDAECQHCNGTGNIKGDILQLKGDDFVLFNRKFSMANIDLLIRICSLVDATKIKIFNSKITGGTVFEFKNIELLLMDKL